MTDAEIYEILNNPNIQITLEQYREIAKRIMADANNLVFELCKRIKEEQYESLC